MTRFLELPDKYSPPERGQRWRDILGGLPDLPVAESGERRILRRAENFDHHSWHMPEMYPLWPFQVYGLGLPDLELMRDTFLHGVSARNRERTAAWSQGFIHYARLGMTAKAQEKAVGKLRDGPYRFPAFWPENVDWTPDMNWGGSGMVGIQEMLLQTHPPAPARQPVGWNPKGATSRVPVSARRPPSAVTFPTTSTPQSSGLWLARLPAIPEWRSAIRYPLLASSHRSARRDARWGGRVPRRLPRFPTPPPPTPCGCKIP